eukprot:TRINITY_DN56546_c0_g1_i1.p1 TRINITY_DN56546_c0_g1~~TRINITY_DN56546_c0_g1_i1.p1  ORF type:complete len:216 (-),score=21.11 TRINITY_DN56546_c0_g1_i1:41-688(-)
MSTLPAILQRSHLAQCIARHAGILAMRFVSQTTKSTQNLEHSLLDSFLDWDDVFPRRMYVFGGLGMSGASALKSCERHLSVGSRERRTASPQGRDGAVAACIADRVYICGGWNGESLNSAQCFDFLRHSWLTLSPMAAKRFGAVGGNVDGRLWMVGGSDGRQCLSSAEEYQIAADRWESLPSLSKKRYRAAAAVVGQHFFICGGSDGSDEALHSA